MVHVSIEWSNCYNYSVGTDFGDLCDIMHIVT